jgi:HPt (histidine-containing phosphotransfer) domain-containing protein
MTGSQPSAFEIAAHLDLTVIGRVCNSIGLPGCRSVLASFLSDASGHHAALLAALAHADHAATRERAHALKGAAASLGLIALRSIAERLEGDAEAFDTQAFGEAAAELQARLTSARDLLQAMGLA